MNDEGLDTDCDCVLAPPVGGQAQYLEWLGLGVLGIMFGLLVIMSLKKSQVAAAR